MEKFYTLQEVAKMLKLSERTIFRHLEGKKLKGKKIGGVWRFTKTQIQNFISHKT